MPRFPAGVTVKVHRRGPRDDFGGRSAATVHEIHRVGLAPRRSAETNTPTRNTLAFGLTAFMPIDADIRATDVVELADGTRWNVVGEPMRWRSPHSGWSPACEVDLERVTG